MRPMVHAWFEPEMLVGTEARGYKLEKVAGFGGFGAVYLTKSPQGDPRAVKVLYPPHSGSSPDLLAWANRAARFLREVQIVARFDHQNIIKIYDAGYLYWRFDDPLKGQQGHQDRSDGYLLPFYVTEYIPDGLDQHVRGEQLFDTKEVVRIGAEICDGLAALHGSNPRVLHLDLNPGNIRLAELAMWQSRAEALDCWPTASENCTWETLRALASSTDGWGMFGHPEWGRLKYGFGRPGKSNSATFTEVLNCMSGLKKRSGITLDDVHADSPCGEAIVALEKAELLIFERSERALRDMRERGPEYLDAVTAYENKVIEVSQDPLLPEPIVAVYPQDGTIVATHPFAILDGAPWVEPVQAKAADVFLQFLLSEQQQSRLVDDGLRPTDPTKPLRPPIDPLYGADPEANLALVEVPGTQVIDAIVELWTCMRLGDCPR